MPNSSVLGLGLDWASPGQVPVVATTVRPCVQLLFCSRWHCLLVVIHYSWLLHSVPPLPNDPWVMGRWGVIQMSLLEQSIPQSLILCTLMRCLCQSPSTANRSFSVEGWEMPRSMGVTMPSATLILGPLSRILVVGCPRESMTLCVAICSSFWMAAYPVSVHPTIEVQARLQAAPDYSAAVSRPQPETWQKARRNNHHKSFSWAPYKQIVTSASGDQSCHDLIDMTISRGLRRRDDV